MDRTGAAAAAAALTALLAATGVASGQDAAPAAWKEPSAARLSTATRSAPRPADALDDARRLLERGDAERAERALREFLETAPSSAAGHELLGDALAELDRADEAAHAYDRAVQLLGPAGDVKLVRAIRRKLKKVDPRSPARQGFFAKTVELMRASGEELIEEGELERGLDQLERIAPLAEGKEHAEIEALVASVRSKEEEVDLDAAGEGGADRTRPVVRVETEHYELVCNLERDVVELVAETMEDIFDNYVEIYLDGDEASADLPRVTLRVYGSWADMASAFPGMTPSPGLGGWWSPAENKVVCYDTRERTGTLDHMLETLFHEASHQFMQILSKRGGWAPAWINEGTACFFEGARAMTDGRVLWPDAAVGRLNALWYGLESRGGPGALAVIAYPNPGSYPGEFYAWGWGLVYYLMEYEDPVTLEHPFRPLYSEYRERVTVGGGKPLELFEEIFLGERSPLKHRKAADFERDWRRWILEEIKPMYIGNAQRALRMKKADLYIDSAARLKDTAPERVERLLEKALSHLEYVRQSIDGPEHPDESILRRELEVARGLERPRLESLFIERLLDLHDEGRLELPAAEYSDLESRLRRIDRKNSSLRKSRARVQHRVRAALKMLEDYAELDPPLPLRAYTFAAEAAAVLGDPQLEELAVDLRARASAAGLIAASGRKLFVPDESEWTTIFRASDEKSFRQSPLAVSVEGVGMGHAGRVCSSLTFSGEYEVRGELAREGELGLGAVHGVVFSATGDGEWMIVGLDYEGVLVVQSATRGANGVVTHETWDEVELDPPVAADETCALRIHVWPEGSLEVQVGEREPVAIELPVEMPTKNRVGLFVAGGKVTLTNPVVEEYR